MLHRRTHWWAGLLVAVLLLTSASAALAQGGGGDKYVFGSSYTLPAGETLNGSLFVAGGSATLERGSAVNGNVSVAGGSVEIAGQVHGDVNVVGGSASLAATAVVGGNLNRVGGSINEAPGAVVHGARQSGAAPRFNPPGVVTPRRNIAPLTNDGPFSGILRLILRFFGALGMGLLLALIGVVVLLVIPGPTGQVATTVGREPALNFAAGLLTLVLAILIGFPLLIACGLGLIVWLVALIALIFGWVAVGLWLGRRIFGLIKVQTASSLAEVAIGVFLLTWLAWVSPRCIGFLFGLVVGAIGVGAVLLTRFGTQPSGGLGGLGGRPAGGAAGSQGGDFAPDRGVVARPAPRAPSLEPVDPEAPLAVADEAGDQPAFEAPVVAGETIWSEPPVEGPVVAAPQEPTAGSEVSETAASAANETVDEQPAVDAAMLPAGAMPDTRSLSEESGLDAASEPATRTDSVALDDLEAVSGITPEIAERLRAAGSTTLIALATSDVETLATQAGVDGEQVRREDWIGQARQLLR